MITIFAPVASSSFNFEHPFLTASISESRATPPPGTIPSSTAALVAFSASSILNFFSFISNSVAAPTPINATPPANLATLS